MRMKKNKNCLVCVKIELNVDSSNIHSINLMWASQ